MPGGCSPDMIEYDKETGGHDIFIHVVIVG